MGPQIPAEGLEAVSGSWTYLPLLIPTELDEVVCTIPALVREMQTLIAVGLEQLGPGVVLDEQDGYNLGVAV